MRNNELSLLIGGPAGSGINVGAEIFAKACVRAGLEVFSNVEYHSNIHGRQIFYRVRVGDEPVDSHVEHVDLLLALDSETLFGNYDETDYQRNIGHLHRLAPGAAVIVDTRAGISPDAIGRDDVALLSLPFDEIVKSAVESGGATYQARRHSVMRNMVPIGAACALLQFETDQVVNVVAERLPAHRQDLVELNRLVLRKAWESARERLGTASFDVALRPREQARSKLLMRGVEAVAIGKVSAGCGLQTYYPIAPASDESVYLETIQSDYPIVVVQAEDEIASMNMAVGAAHAGIRASTSTAGPGFSLMAEGVGFASMTEAPGPVVVLYQRGGPSTGLPTRNSQQDLRFAVQPSHGEFPHIVVAPGGLQEAARYTVLAFNWGDRYQVPVVVLLDKVTANSWFTVDDLDLANLPVDVGEIWSPDANGDEPYRRHRLTDTGISPRAIFGTPDGTFVTTTDEHTERGRIDEDTTNRMRQMEKRMGKLELIAEEIPDEDQLTLHGPDDAEITIVAWGSTVGPISDARRVLAREHGVTANHLQIRLMCPFPAELVRTQLERANQLMLLEDNYTGQLGGLVAEHTGIELKRRVLKYDGRPFSQDEVVEAALAHLRTEVERLVVSHP